MEKVIVVGDGGREYEIGRCLAASERVDQVLFFGGNAGTAQLPKSQNVANTGLDDLHRLAYNNAAFVVIGPEAPLVAGWADYLRSGSGDVFGPDSKGAKLEGSKSYAVRFMREYGIPHPESTIVNNPGGARHYMEKRRAINYVIKADGLAGGKGVKVPSSEGEARQIVANMLNGQLFGEAGMKIVFQERLRGPELSIQVLFDGQNAFQLPYSQDHKRLLDGDKGPNTGGMGAYAPFPETKLTERQTTKLDDIIRASLEGIKRREVDFRGVLYIGVMLAEEYDNDPMVIEYNVRFGDPETQVVLPLVQAAGIDVYDLLRATTERRLADYSPVTWSSLGYTALSVCMAAKGYPDDPITGDTIQGLKRKYSNIIIQHGATAQTEKGIVTAGGRVLNVTGLARTFDEAARHVDGAIGKHALDFEGVQFRSDIGYQVRGQ